MADIFNAFSVKKKYYLLLTDPFAEWVKDDIRPAALE